MCSQEARPVVMNASELHLLTPKLSPHMLLSTTWESLTEHSRQLSREDKYSRGILRNKTGCHVGMLNTGKKVSPSRDRGIPGAQKAAFKLRVEV